MDSGKHTPRKFLLYFDDPDRGMAVFTDENEAREAFSKANTAWNCYLFGAMPLASRTPAEGASVGADEIRNCYDEYCRQNPNDVTWMTPTGVMIRAILQKFDVRPK